MAKTLKSAGGQYKVRVMSFASGYLRATSASPSKPRRRAAVPASLTSTWAASPGSDLISQLYSTAKGVASQGRSGQAGLGAGRLNRRREGVLCSTSSFFLRSKRSMLVVLVQVCWPPQSCYQSTRAAACKVNTCATAMAASATLTASLRVQTYIVW